MGDGGVTTRMVGQFLFWLQECEKEVYEIFNIVSSNPKTINEMVSTIEKIVNKKAKIKYESKPIGDVNKTFGNIKKAKELLNWKPTVSFEDGIKSFIEWYLNNEE